MAWRIGRGDLTDALRLDGCTGREGVAGQSGSKVVARKTTRCMINKI